MIISFHVCLHYDRYCHFKLTVQVTVLQVFGLTCSCRSFVNFLGIYILVHSSAVHVCTCEAVRSSYKMCSDWSTDVYNKKNRTQ